MNTLIPQASRDAMRWLISSLFPSVAPIQSPKLTRDSAAASARFSSQVSRVSVGGEVFGVSAVTGLGFELHARAYYNLLYARGFGPSNCAAGAAGAGAAECREVASRFRQRDDAANVMLGAGVAAGVLALSAGLAVALEPKGAGVKVTATPTASAGGGGLAVRGTW